MLWRFPYNPTAYDDDWEDQPGQGWFYHWGLGLLLPLAFVGYGAYVMATRHAEFGSQITVTLRGPNAIAFGAAWVSAAMFVHCHYFWGNVYNQAWIAVLGKILAGFGFIGALLFLLVRNGVLGRG